MNDAQSNLSRRQFFRQAFRIAIPAIGILGLGISFISCEPEDDILS